MNNFCEPASGAWQFVSRANTSSTPEGSQLAPLAATFSLSFRFPVVTLSSFAQSPVNEISSRPDEKLTPA